MAFSSSVSFSTFSPSTPSTPFGVHAPESKPFTSSDLQIGATSNLVSSGTQSCGANSSFGHEMPGVVSNFILVMIAAV